MARYKHEPAFRTIGKREQCNVQYPGPSVQFANHLPNNTVGRHCKSMCSYQFIPYQVNNQPVVVRHAATTSPLAFQENHIHYGSGSPIPSPAYAVPSPYSNRSAVSPFYEEVVATNGRCSLPLGSNDRPISADIFSIPLQSPSY